MISSEQDDQPSLCIGQRLDAALAALLPDISRTQLRNLIEGEHVTLNGHTVTKPRHKIHGGDRLRITIPPAASNHIAGEPLPLTIVYEDDHLIVINKPTGLVVHPGAGNHSGTLVNALIHHCQGSLSGIGGVERPGIVHRLDKDTSGLMVVAKTNHAHQHLTKQFASRTIGRKYMALVWGLPKPLFGTIDGSIARSRFNRQKMTITETHGKEARTEYRVQEIYDEVASLVACTLHSGRTHQIRVHMASIGHGLVGDTTYGRLPRFPTAQLRARINAHLAAHNHQHLHAYELHFIHPETNKEISFEANTPYLFDKFKKEIKIT
ncbi:MAG: RluA family pseudouridine synthase [Alphaproteobacteria bacterium]|nr:MAG: RluA family pseudouridine synthase [Alphaproteobacteria bacterium]